MKKTFILEDLDCAACAAKIESAVAGIDGVEKASVNFMTQKMIIEANEAEFDSIIKAAKKKVKRIEPGTKLLEA